MELAQLKAVIEALIFASPDPITPRMLYKLLNDEPKEDVKAALDALKADYVDRGGLHIAEVAGGFQITTRPEYPRVGAPAVPRALGEQAVGRRARNAVGDCLQAAGDRRGDRRDSQRQHLGRAVDAARAALDQDRRPQERIGRPFLYGTTKEFLIRFGLNDLGDLPKIEDMAQQLGFEPPPILMERPVPKKCCRSKKATALKDLSQRTHASDALGARVGRNVRDCDHLKMVNRSVLRGDQRPSAVVLIVPPNWRADRWSRPAQLRRRRASRCAAFNGLRHVDQFDRRAAALARDLGAERQQVVAIR
jgi:segregation and condensation protein B